MVRIKNSLLFTGSASRDQPWIGSFKAHLKMSVLALSSGGWSLKRLFLYGSAALVPCLPDQCCQCVVQSPTLRGEKPSRCALLYYIHVSHINVQTYVGLDMYFLKYRLYTYNLLHFLIKQYSCNLCCFYYHIIKFIDSYFGK